MPRWIVLVLAIVVAAGCSDGNGDETGTGDADETGGIVDLEDFLVETEGASFEDFADVEGSQVSGPDEFEIMREYVLTIYDGAVPTSSFVLEGRVVDCITIDSQPSVRLLDLGEVSSPPEGTIGGDVVGDEGEAIESADSILREGRTDEFGNPIACEEGSVPMTRITLGILVRYETLASFFAKGPDGTERLPEISPEIPEPEVGAGERRYAFAFQQIDNYGGNSWLNLWNPDLGATGTMSLSQQWYSAGQDDGTQTVEGGWQVLPSKYETTNAVLFIYWTADNYETTGCYNLDCAGFVQISSNWYLGGIWSNYSTTGGTQWGFELQWKLYEDNWWLFLKGPGDYEAVGYYPSSIYDGGPLAESATSALYGGETATTQRWPEMGSGQFAADGWQSAAFQNTIFYIPRNENNGVGVWADLTEQALTPDCYTIELTSAANGGSWGTYIYFGGPGGDPC